MAKKTPKASTIPDPQKVPRISPALVNTKFTWSFSILDKGGPFGWSNCQSHEKFLEILEKKGSFEEKDLTELYYQKSHSIPVKDLSSEARRRLIEIKLDDVEALFSFRINGPNRIFCIKQEKIMRVLWWDPDHQVYPVEKKNT